MRAAFSQPESFSRYDFPRFETSQPVSYTHLTILSNWYLGEKPQGVYGLKANFNPRFGDAEDYASLMVRYPEAVSILERCV